MLVKTVSPTSTITEEGKKEKATRLQYKAMKDGFFQKSMSHFKRHCGKLFEDLPAAAAKKRDEKLLHIFRKAHDVARRLWTQGYKIECVALPRLQSGFVNKSLIVQAHPTMHLDGMDTSRDGEEIYFVTKPHVRAWGNDEGDFIDEWRSFDAASVCMAPKKQLEQAMLLLEEHQKSQDHTSINIGTGSCEAPA